MVICFGENQGSPNKVSLTRSLAWSASCDDTSPQVYVPLGLTGFSIPLHFLFASGPRHLDTVVCTCWFLTLFSLYLLPFSRRSYWTGGTWVFLVTQVSHQAMKWRAWVLGQSTGLIPFSQWSQCFGCQGCQLQTQAQVLGNPFRGNMSEDGCVGGKKRPLQNCVYSGKRLWIVTVTQKQELLSSCSFLTVQRSAVSP